MATLGNQTKANTYGNLLQIPNSNLGIDSTLRTAHDGKGNSLPFALSTTRFDFSVAPSAVQNTTSERFGLSSTSATFAECSLFGQSTVSAYRASVVIGYGAYSETSDYVFSPGNFGGAPTIVGTQAYGSGTSIGYQAYTGNMEAIAVGPKAQATKLACLAIGDGARAIPTGVNGNQIVFGDAMYAKGNINWVMGGGFGVEQDYVWAVGVGGSTAYTLNASTADHQALLGWYQHDHASFSAGQGFLNDWYVGGPQVASAPHAITWNVTSGLGSNIAGVDWTFNGSRGTGNAAAGAWIFKTADVGASGSTLQTLTTKMNITRSGVGIGAGVTPTAMLHIAAGTTAAAQLRFAPGVAPSSPNDGDVYYVDTNDRLMFRKNATDVELLLAAAVNSVSPTSPNRTITIVHNGTTYYIAAKTTND